MKNIQIQYEKRWKVRLKRESSEPFSQYERNGVLPSLFRKNEKVLDLASGNSIVGEYLQKNFNCKVTAMDFSKEAISDAKKRGVRGIVSSVEEKLPFGKNTFDMVFWGDNIEHIFHPENVMKEISRVLRPGGRLILSTPNQAYWRYRLHTFITGRLPHTEGEANRPWEWGHIRFFTRGILKDLFKELDFVETRFLGVSRRKPDRFILPLMPEWFGMIMVVEARVGKNKK